jgi:type II secretory ATPase GspE/PulE/Tfp pilus assembly ATPase PilB-like protein
LVVSDGIKRLIHAKATVAELAEVALAEGMTTLLQDGVHKVLAGWTDYTQVKAAAIR